MAYGKQWKQVTEGMKKLTQRFLGASSKRNTHKLVKTSISVFRTVLLVELDLLFKMLHRHLNKAFKQKFIRVFQKMG